MATASMMMREEARSKLLGGMGDTAPRAAGAIALSAEFGRRRRDVDSAAIAPN